MRAQDPARSRGSAGVRLLVVVLLWPAARALPQTAGSPSFEDRLMELVNAERWAYGQLPPLKRNVLLDTSAEGHSRRMGEGNFFSHCDPADGSHSWDRIAAAGYPPSYTAENITAWASTPEAALAGWMGSSGHRANILSTSFRELGLGYYLDATDSSNVALDLNSNCIHSASEGFGGPYFHYWTQNFGRSSTYPVVIEREAFSTPTHEVELYLYGAGFAVDMRLRNAGGVWSSWLPFDESLVWGLSPGGGLKTVEVELRSALGAVLTASDSIFIDGFFPEVFADGFESGSTGAWQ